MIAGPSQLPWVLLGTTILFACPATAQPITTSGLQLEATSDERRRGLSWSAGRPTIAAAGYVSLGEEIELGAGVTGLRRSRRHGGADIAADLTVRVRRTLGPWRLSAGLSGHGFTGRSRLNYAEGGVQAAYLIGPVTLALGASFAPRQRAIGGSNLNLAASADVAVPGTGWTIRGGVGHSSGRTRDPIRAARLRPQDSYFDYRLAVEHVRGALTVGGRLTATSINHAVVSSFDDAERGAQFAAFVRADF